MHVYIHALGGERDQGECGALLLADGCFGLGLVLGINGILGDVSDGLLLAVAGGEREED
jgi:hypothetical protein